MTEQPPEEGRAQQQDPRLPPGPRLRQARIVGQGYGFELTETEQSDEVVADRYDLRSHLVHGGIEPVSIRDASAFEYWLTHRLMPSVLDWLADHPEHPVQDLDMAIRSLPVDVHAG